jgi:hypothetical protein
VVIDLVSRRVVGWSMQPEIRSHLVIDALEMAGYTAVQIGVPSRSSIAIAAASTPAMSLASCLSSAASPLR